MDSRSRRCPSGKEALRARGRRRAARLHHSRRADAGNGRAGDAAAADAGGPLAERHHAFLLERSDHGRGSHPARRARLPDQAVRKAGTRRGISEVPPETAASLGKSGAAGILRGPDRRHLVPRRQPADAEDPPADSADRAGGRARVHQRRKRRRQGSGGADDPPALDAPAAGLYQGELRGAARRAAGIRAFRLRAGRLYRRGAREARQIRTGQQGHDFSGRNRGNEPAPAGQAAARAAGRPYSRGWARARW